MITITLGVRFLTDAEAMLTQGPNMVKSDMMKALIEFFFSPNQIGCQILDSFVIISEKKGLLEIMVQTQLTSCLIRYLEALHSISLNELAPYKNTASKYLWHTRCCHKYIPLISI